MRVSPLASTIADNFEARAETEVVVLPANVAFEVRTGTDARGTASTNDLRRA